MPPRDELRAPHSVPGDEVLRLGFIPLSDSAPLLIAQEQGLFEAEGLRVELCREHSWASLRDKLGLGLLHGAQMLVSLPIATRLGVCGPKLDLVSAFVLDLNGNAITLDRTLYERLLEVDASASRDPLAAARALRLLNDRDRLAGRSRLRFGVVFPTSPQNYELRYWLASGGIDPDRDVDIVVAPPPQMVELMSARAIVGFCVGEPWNTHAVREGLGAVVATKNQLWNNSPDKVFAVSEEWAARNPNTHRALLRALLKACIWLDQPENRLSAAYALTRKNYLDLPLDSVSPSLTGRSLRHPQYPEEDAPDFHVFHRYSANFPWLNHAEWFIAQMYRWGQLDVAVDIASAAEQVFWPDLYREVARDLAVPCPAINRKTEGDQLQPMLFASSQQLGPNGFLNGERFEVGGILQYLERQRISRADLTALRAVNESAKIRQCGACS